jgi:hypothetical protein
MFEISFQLFASIGSSEAAREFVHAIAGDIRETESAVVVGRISALLVQVGRIADAGENLFEVMDDASSELGKYHIALFKSDDCEYKDSIRQQFGDVFGLDLLVLNHIDIVPTFRGRGLGLLVVSRTIDIFGENCGLVAMKPFPLQFANYLDAEWHAPEGIKDPKAAFQTAVGKLRRHWARAGFRRINETDYCALSPARKRPALKRVATAL